MTREEMEIGKEFYDRAMENGGHITKEDEYKLFSPSIIYGYGLYGTSVFERDGKYYVSYSCGDSCD